MSCFDKVYFRCKRCREFMEVQSKAGPCRMHEYHYPDSAIPPSVAADLDGQTVRCGCGNEITIQAHVILTVY